MRKYISHAYVYMCISVHIHCTRISTLLYESLVGICKRMHVCMCVGTYDCVHVYTRECTHVYTRECTHVYTR